MHTAIIERMSRYTRWFRQYKAAKGYSALQELADKIDLNGYLDKTVAKAIRTTRIIGYELELWGSVNIQDKNGWTALHNAAYYNAVESLKVLLPRPEIDVNIQNKWGLTALHFAAWYNAVDVLKVLVNFGVDKSIKSKDGKLAYDLTTNKEIREMLKPKS